MRRHAKALIAVLVAMLVLGASAAVALQTHSHEASRDLNGTEDFTGDPDTVPAGSFCCVNGVAVDQSNGDLYFADGAEPPNAYGAIYRYDQSGAYQARFNVSESLANPQDVAIDSSGTASDGTLYVADTGNNRLAAIDSATGNFVAGFGTGGSINGVEDSPGDPDTTPTNGFSSPCGIAIDQSNGNLFVADQGNNRIWIFDSSGAYLNKIADSTLQGPCGLAFDSTGRLFVRNANDGKVVRFDRATATEYNGSGAFYSASEGGASDVAVDPSNDHVFVDRGDRIAEYDSGGSPISTFGQGTLCCSGGVAVDSNSGRIYASQFGNVYVFGALITLPEATTSSASSITGNSATVSGTIDPAGGPEADCEFEYGTSTSYGQTAPCDPTGPFSSPEAVTASLSGLNPATTYHYRLHASNTDGSGFGSDQTFTTNGPPLVTKFFASEVSGSGATLNATIDPAGLDTSYRFEYTSNDDFEANGFATATHVPIPDGEITGSSQSVSQDIGGLTPATVYRFRVVAENSIDEVASAPKAFRTFPPQTSPSIGSFPGQGFLPDNRAWELVSPPEKLGSDINAVSARIRIAADGSAVAFASLGGFADAQGTGVQVDYVAERTEESGTNGWSTHGIMPHQEALSQSGVLAFIDPRYYGDFSADLNRGVFFARSPVTDDPNVARVANLYMRTDMRSSGKGNYELLTACPLCEEEGKPLPPPIGDPLLGIQANPYLGGVTPDLSEMAFESRQRLTADTPEQSPFCDFHSEGIVVCGFQAYVSDGNEVHHVGRIPVAPAIACDDTGGPACQGAAVSRLGMGVSNGTFAMVSTPNVISDGSSGHTAVFFTYPTEDGVTPPFFTFGDKPGSVYARIDNTKTVQLNASERTDCAGDPSCGGDDVPDPAPESFVPAWYQGASADGTRAFFSTEEALTDDAPPAVGDERNEKLYMYDLGRPASDPHNLTLLNADTEPGDGYNFLGLVGYSNDGHYVYFEADGDLLPGESTGAINPNSGAPSKGGIYLWHDGGLTYIGSSESNARNPFQGPGGALSGNMENLTINEWENHPKLARVTPDGRHLLFTSHHGEGLLSVRGGVDHECIESCRELYLYSAHDDRLRCVSCSPTGAPTVKGVASDVVTGHIGRGATRRDWHETTALSNDGRYVFFSTNQQLVPADRNGPCKGIHSGSNEPEEFPCTDAYAFDSVTGEVSLLSSGEDSSASVFLEATPDGKNALIATRERLSGWDFDSSYDIYDVRVNGGLPEPPPPPPSCQGDACQPPPVGLNDPTPSSSSFTGPGNKEPRKAHKKKRHSRKGKHHKQGKKHKRSHNHNGRASR